MRQAAATRRPESNRVVAPGHGNTAGPGHGSAALASGASIVGGADAPSYGSDALASGAPVVGGADAPSYGSAALASAAPVVGGADALRGRPSAWWRFGQDRRLALVTTHGRLEQAQALDLGCGLGAYTLRLRAAGAQAVGLEVEVPRAAAAWRQGAPAAVGVGERLPFATAGLDLILLHEVLEHVADDRRTMAEVARVLRTGGRALIFAPNRLWPFETHGIVWRDKYRFGNAPLINYLPDPLRNQLAPHVRTYTRGALRALVRGLPLIERHWRCVYPGYDKLSVASPLAATVLRALTYGLESTPLHRFGLSHFMVLERSAAATPSA